MRKATALDGIPIEVQNFIQVDKIILIRSYRKKHVWCMKNAIVSIYKGKEDYKICTNFIGIKFVCHSVKLWENVVEYRSKNYFDFMQGKSTEVVIYFKAKVAYNFSWARKNLW